MNETAIISSEKGHFVAHSGRNTPVAAPGSPDTDDASAMLLHSLHGDRFTLDGSQALEAHLASVCERVAQEVQRIVPPSQLDGILLAGGYGRGEGGVLRDERGDHPYNDLEFYVFARGNAFLMERRYRAALHRLGERLTPDAGLEVEFKVLSLAKLRRSGPSMFYYDLLSGHRWILGGDCLLAGCEHHREAHHLPRHEATRLLFNRCSGLLFSAERLRRPRFGSSEADFVGRNLAKAQLGIGDALLAAHGQYHWSCRERHQRLARLELNGTGLNGSLVSRHHAEGVAFKLHPVRSEAGREDLARRHAEVSSLARTVWLHLERQRLGIPLADPVAYATSRQDKCPETPALRNRLVNAQAFGPLAALQPRGARYPRERLFNSLALLLWNEPSVTDPRHLRFLQRELDTRATEFAGLVGAYEQLWHRFH